MWTRKSVFTRVILLVIASCIWKVAHRSNIIVTVSNQLSGGTNHWYFFYRKLVALQKSIGNQGLKAIDFGQNLHGTIEIHGLIVYAICTRSELVSRDFNLNQKMNFHCYSCTLKFRLIRDRNFWLQKIEIWSVIMFWDRRSSIFKTLVANYV